VVIDCVGVDAWCRLIGET